MTVLTDEEKELVFVCESIMTNLEQHPSRFIAKIDGLLAIVRKLDEMLMRSMSSHNDYVATVVEHVGYETAQKLAKLANIKSEIWDLEREYQDAPDMPLTEEEKDRIVKRVKDEGNE